MPSSTRSASPTGSSASMVGAGSGAGGVGSMGGVGSGDGDGGSIGGAGLGSGRGTGGAGSGAGVGGVISAVRRRNRRARKPRRGGSIATGSGSGSDSGSGSGSSTATGSGSGSGCGTDHASSSGATQRRGSTHDGSACTAVSVTRVPQPAESRDTVPLARSPSQATVLSGSRLVMRTAPNGARW